MPHAAPEIANVITSLRPAAAAREIARDSPAGALRQLLDAGLGALRVPAWAGGPDHSLVQVADVLIDLATADSNLTQILRGHFGLVEILRRSARNAFTSELLRRVATGAQFGPAGTERGTNSLAEPDTRLVEVDGRLFLTGRKYYTTGALFADAINVLVRVDGRFVSVIVDRNARGVSVIDDWDGFGQRLTASGTAVFDHVAVDPGNLIRHDDPLTNDYMDAFYQFVHSATQAGIAQAIADDATHLVRNRQRSYPLASTPHPAADPQVLQVVGTLAANAFAARAAVLLTAATLDAFTVEPSAVTAERAILDSSATQVTVTRLVGESAWQLFDAGSASAVDTSLNLHRHWRNARTISSHNPAQYKATQLGAHAVNGTRPHGFLNTGTENSTTSANGIPS